MPEKVPDANPDDSDENHNHCLRYLLHHQHSQMNLDNLNSQRRGACLPVSSLHLSLPVSMKVEIEGSLSVACMLGF